MLLVLQEGVSRNSNDKSRVFTVVFVDHCLVGEEEEMAHVHVVKGSSTGKSLVEIGLGVAWLVVASMRPLRKAVV